jgi:PPK2 family polyphosphate:nucleotide phosphotransferase
MSDSLRERLAVKPGSRVHLADWDPRDTFGHDKAKSEPKVVADLQRLSSLQERLYAEARQSLLIVLQAIDAGGKDGTVRHVMSGFNPLGCHVVSFKVPTPDELAHDFLWRVHRSVPGRGEIGIFNRSHYEDVLVVRVHELVPQPVWSARYDQINAFESLLAAAGTRVLKFFLCISKDEQRQRLQERHDNPRKKWKFSMGDLEERKLWDDYMAAYEDALSETSTSDSPWYAIPSNRNWFRDLAISKILADTLDDLKPTYPEPEDFPENLVVE